MSAAINVAAALWLAPVASLIFWLAGSPWWQSFDGLSDGEQGARLLALCLLHLGSLFAGGLVAASAQETE